MDSIQVGSVMGMEQIKSKKRVADHGEVYTNEREVNSMLDMLGETSYDIFATFLEPSCGNGNFLVKILERKLKTVDDTFRQNQQEYEKHCLIAISTIYGVDILPDNIEECKDRLLQYCNNENAKQILNDNIVCGNMLTGLRSDGTPIEFKTHFTAIVGNPPYHLKDGGHGASAKPLYHKFIEKAKELKPKYISMIIPARWYVGGKGLDDFRAEMLEDTRIKELHDFKNSKECFPKNSIEGGICYFLWDKTHSGDCLVVNEYDKSELYRRLKGDNLDIFIGPNKAISIYEKVKTKTDKTFESLVSSRKPFGLDSKFRGSKNKISEDDIMLYSRNREVTYIKKTPTMPNNELVDEYKILISSAYGMGNVTPYKVLGNPFISKPGSCCTSTYLVIGPFENETTCKNVISYINTKFFRFLVSLLKTTQHGTQKVYSLVPLQDFTKLWTDDELYEKYNLNKDEIQFIESMIKERTASDITEDNTIADETVDEV